MHSIMRVSLVFVVIIPLLFFPRLFFGWFTSFNWVHCSMLLRSCCYNAALTSVNPSFFPSKNILFPPIVVPCMNYIHHKACNQKHFSLTWIINVHIPFGFVEWVVCLLAWWWPSWHGWHTSLYPQRVQQGMPQRPPVMPPKLKIETACLHCGPA